MVALAVFPVVVDIWMIAYDYIRLSVLYLCVEEYLCSGKHNREAVKSTAA